MIESPQSDHDLLIRLDTKMDRSAEDIKSLAQGVEQVRKDVSVMSESMEIKIAAAVSGKADTSIMEKYKTESDKLHEKQDERMESYEEKIETVDRKIDRYIWMLGGVLGAGQLALTIWLAFFK
jgi:hypothetical protein